jgi:CBS domain-containing protein
MTQTNRSAVFVGDIMTQPVAVIDSSTRVREAMELMRRHHIRHLPVVNNGLLEGFLSQNDLRETLGFQTDEWLVKERLDWAVFRVMNEDGPRLNPQRPIRDAIDLFLATKAGAIPVVEEGSGQLVGILSNLDVLRAARDLFSSQNGPMANASICVRSKHATASDGRCTMGSFSLNEVFRITGMPVNSLNRLIRS